MKIPCFTTSRLTTTRLMTTRLTTARLTTARLTALPLLLALTLLAGCSAPSGDANAPAATAPAMSSESSATADISPDATTAEASGVVEAVDVAGKTITIAHGPVDALKWPAMTMTFHAPDADLGSIKPGDHVAFEFSSTGMNGTITTITRQ